MIINFPNHIDVKENLPLGNYSTFKIGGSADIAIFPKSNEEFICVVDLLKDNGVRFDVIGNASNILFDDGGYRGTLIFTSKMNEVEYITSEGGDTLVRVGCGKSLTMLAGETLKKHHLAGLEFAYGIPGSVGGAVFMNAGAYGGEMSDVIVETVCYDADKKQLITYSAPEHCFSYRRSIFQENKNALVLSTLLRLRPDETGEALASALANFNSRKEKQPLEYPNAGSMFKRPEGYIAAKLIDECGLKGLSVGNAEVSCKHAGFIINKGGATSAEVLELCEMIKQKILDAYGVALSLEVIYIPEK